MGILNLETAKVIESTRRVPDRKAITNRYRTSGFTLLEILVVVLIISILATVVGVNIIGKPTEARIAATKAQIVDFRNALSLYKLSHGTYPAQAQGLEALCRKPTAPPVPDRYPDGGYLESRNLPRDQWDNDYVYLVPGAEGEPFEIISYGADGEPGGENEFADISSLDM